MTASTILIPLALVLMALTAITLARGIAAFLRSTREDLERGDQSGPSAMQLKQNSMMMRRILYQAATIVVVGILLFAAKH